MVDLLKASTPMASLTEPSTFRSKAFLPIAMFSEPVLLAFKAPSPIAILAEIPVGTKKTGSSFT